MRDVLDPLVRWWRSGEPVVVATTVRTSSSAPREVGATMLVGPGGTVVGNVSGGCVESDVYDVAGEVLRTGVPVLRSYGVTDDDAFAVGLSCGGRIEVFAERVDGATFPQLGDVVDDIRGGVPVALVTCVDPAVPAPWGRRLVVHRDGAAGRLGPADLTEAAAATARRMLADGRSGVVAVKSPSHGGTVAVFVSSYRPAPRMLVFGAVQVSAAVAELGSILGYRVTACDARATFATRQRVPAADEVIVDRPDRYLRQQASAQLVDERTVICAFTHDPKFDVPLLETALRLPVAYVGAMGSRTVHADRLRQLQAAGLTETELARLHSPIGLDLGGSSPQETAVSVVAEILAVRYGGTGAPLGLLTGPLHRRAAEHSTGPPHRHDAPHSVQTPALSERAFVTGYRNEQVAGHL